MAMADTASKRSREEPVAVDAARGGKKRSRGYADPSSSTAKPTGGTVRRACDPCRTSKSACTFKEQSSICAACERKRIVCTSSFSVSESAPPSVPPETAVDGTTNTPVRRLSSSSVVDAPNAQPTSLTPDELARVDPSRTTEEPISKDANVQRLIAVYFFRIYNVSWHGFLHKATFLQRLRKGDIPRHLLTSVCLAAAVVLGLEQEDCKTRLAGLLQQIGEAMTMPTLDLLATILNAIYCELAFGRMSSVWMLSGMANRIALAHQLTLPSPPTLPQTIIQVRHRLLWACYCIDTAITRDAPQLAQFPDIDALTGIPLPTNERRFLLRQPGNPRALKFPWVPPSGEYVFEEGMPAQNVIVFALCHQVVRYRANGSLDRPWIPGSQFEARYRDLVAWRTGLNEALEFTEENVYTRIEMGQLTALFAGESAINPDLAQCSVAEYMNDTVHVRYNWAMGTLVNTALQRYDHRYVSEAGSWPGDMARISRDAWYSMSEAAMAIVNVVPDFVPEDPMVADMMITAIEMQLSVAETQDPALVESRVFVLLELLEKMAKPFHGIRAQVRSSTVTFISPRSLLDWSDEWQLGQLLQRQRMILEVLLGFPKMDAMRREYDLPDAMPMDAPATSSNTVYGASPGVRMPGFSQNDDTNCGNNASTSMWNFPLSAHSTPRGYVTSSQAFGPLAVQDQHASPFDYADFEFAMPLYQLQNETSSSRVPDQGSATLGGERWDLSNGLGNVEVAYQMFM
ncbi:hypothetical protein QFC20_006723 [Naganishia adeliensis]|uniref:Uncharacterized protein n=1 Tax=Naganishia adeliensis TaxID=92952 RepID=A0ACC2V720_9TREE|nr:hypothetical protein QFC20_006723 [Naganishia adeliensis]